MSWIIKYNAHMICREEENNWVGLWKLQKSFLDDFVFSAYLWMWFCVSQIYWARLQLYEATVDSWIVRHLGILSLWFLSLFSSARSTVASNRWSLAQYIWDKQNHISAFLFNKTKNLQQEVEDRAQFCENITTDSFWRECDCITK